MSHQKTPHNRTFSDGTQNSSSKGESKEDAFRTSPKPSNEGLRASSIAPAEDTELRELTSKVLDVIDHAGSQRYKTAMALAEWWTKECSRIRAEVLDECRDILFPEYPKVTNPGYSFIINKDELDEKLASLRQEK